MNKLIEAKNKFKNPILKKIVNTYQLVCKDGQKPPGLGDFLKSCFFLLQLCNVLNLEFDINFKNHPISNYLIIEGQEDYNIDYSQVEYPYWAEHNHILNNGLGLFIQKLNSIKTPIYYLCTNGWPIVTIKPPGIHIIRSKINPNEILIQSVKKFMSELHLFNKNFTTIHIRCGDDTFNGKTDLTRFALIANRLYPFLSQNKNSKILIISNSNLIKQYIRKLGFENIYFKISKIVHLGGDGNFHKTTTRDDSALLETLVDFFVMSNSNLIISLSEYSWGSCFSDMCSQIYSIPILQLKI
uniref:Uncharacterized protein n=1 Tax=viral metagenome TaxID=1070528 RepID=A0A6C0B1L4_9ZZZZ